MEKMSRNRYLGIIDLRPELGRISVKNASDADAFFLTQCLHCATVPNVQTTQVTTTNSVDVTTEEYVPFPSFVSFTSDYEDPTTETIYYPTTGDDANTDDTMYDMYVGSDDIRRRAAIEEKVGAWSNRSKRPCKAFIETVWLHKQQEHTSYRWTVCPFGGVGEVTDTRNAEPTVFTANVSWPHMGHWKFGHRATYKMTMPVYDGCYYVKKELEINFVCKEGTRDAVTKVKRHIINMYTSTECHCCTIEMEIATNAAC